LLAKYRALVEVSIKWVEVNISVEFDRSEFEQAVIEFKKSIG
jgi:hypothetical protein